MLVSYALFKVATWVGTKESWFVKLARHRMCKTFWMFTVCNFARWLFVLMVNCACLDASLWSFGLHHQVWFLFTIQAQSCKQNQVEKNKNKRSHKMKIGGTNEQKQENLQLKFEVVDNIKQKMNKNKNYS